MKPMKFAILLLLTQSVLDVGQKYLSTEEYDKAYQIFYQIYSVSKNTQEGNWARYYLSLSLLGMGDTLSALGNLIALKGETFNDSLAYLAFGKILELSRTTEDSIKWISEVVNFFPSSTKRVRLIEKCLQMPLEDSTRTSLVRILASDYESRAYETMLGENLLKNSPETSLLLAQRHNAPLVRLKALYRTGNYVDFYYRLARDNPAKVIPEESVEFLKKTGYSPKVAGLLLALRPENETTAFEFCRALEKMGLVGSKFRTFIKDKLLQSWFDIRKLTLQDLNSLEELPESPLRNFVLAKGYFKEKLYIKSLIYASKLPDSMEYNAFKLELADSMLSKALIFPELISMVESIHNFYPLTEKDEILMLLKSSRGEDVSSILQNLEENLVKPKRRLPARFETPNPADTEVIKILYENFDYRGVIRFSRGKTLPHSMKYYVASSLLYLDNYQEALNLLEDEPSNFPGLYVRALAGIDDPARYVGKIPGNLKPEDAYYLYVVATKTGKPEILKDFKAPAFQFYSAIVEGNLERALTLLDAKDSRMLLSLVKALYSAQQYQRVVEITESVNPLYPLEQEIFVARLNSLYHMRLYDRVLQQGLGYVYLLANEKIYELISLSALNSGNLNLAFLYALRGNTQTERSVYSSILLFRGFIEMVDSRDLSRSDQLLYYYQKKNLKGLESINPETPAEGFQKLKYLTELSGKIPDSLLQVYTDTLGLGPETREKLLGYLYLARNQLDSLLPLVSTLPDPEIIHQTALQLIKQGETDAASNLLKTALDLAGDSLRHDIHFRLGNIEASKGNYSDAIFYYTKSLSYGTTFEKELLYNLAISYKNAGQIDSTFNCLEILRTKYSYDEISIEAAILMGYLMVENQRNPEKAIEILNQVIGTGTKIQDCEALYWLSRAYVTTQDLKAALATLKRIYTYYQEFPDWRDTAKLDAAKLLVYFNNNEMARNLYNEIIKSRAKDDPISQEAQNQKEFFKL